MALCYYLLAFHPILKTEQQQIHKRNQLIQIASAELGVREATGNNDGERVATYLAYTQLGEGYAWCAAFVSWCYGQAGLSQPRNPWSPALFPDARTYCKSSSCSTSNSKSKIAPADVFGIYGQGAKRIIHVGLVQQLDGNFIHTIEGNSNDRVARKRRHLTTVYTLANWL